MTLPKSLTTVTTFSKLLALWLYIFLPFAGFYLGMEYQEKLDQPTKVEQTTTVFSPTIEPESPLIILPTSSLRTPSPTRSINPTSTKPCEQNPLNCIDH